MNKKMIGIFALLIMIGGTGAIALAQPIFKGGFGDREGGKFVPGDENTKFGQMGFKGKFSKRGPGMAMGPGIDRDYGEFQAMMDLKREVWDAKQAYDENPTDENEASLVEKVKEMSATMTGLKLERLDTIKTTIADSGELTDEEKLERIENIDSHIAFLEEMQTQMENAGSVEDLDQIRETMKEKRDEFGFGHRGRPGKGGIGGKDFCGKLSSEGTESAPVV